MAYRQVPWARWGVGVLLAGQALSQPALAQPSATAGPTIDQVEGPPAPAALPRYHHSVYSWEHHVSASTLGVGDVPQSENPTYTMGLASETRYYLRDQPGRLLSLRLVAGAFTELTNNDVTTQRGEWSAIDTGLSLVYGHRFLGPSDTDGTLLEVRPIVLTLPTAKASWRSGRYFAAGALVGLLNIRPILVGKYEPFLLSTIRLAVGYDRWFARATVPTNPGLGRVRLGPDGRSAAGDQLSGASLVRDQLTGSARVRFDFGEAVVWTTDFAFAPSWKYALDEDVSLCSVVATGCTSVPVGASDSRYLVSTQFNTEVSIALVPSLSFELGYGNSANQLGEDGRRRNFFYSPWAEFYASLSFTPHELAAPPKRAAQGVVTAPRL
jgi:hypothetical protein